MRSPNHSDFTTPTLADSSEKVAGSPLHLTAHLVEVRSSASGCARNVRMAVLVVGLFRFRAARFGSSKGWRCFRSLGWRLNFGHRWRSHLGLRHWFRRHGRYAAGSFFLFGFHSSPYGSFRFLLRAFLGFAFGGQTVAPPYCRG